MEHSVIIRFDHVSKTYGENKVLDNISLEIGKGDFVTVIGSSGCGKTTLLKMINGLLSPTWGTVFVEGKDVSEADQTLLRRHIGYVIQGIGLFPHMTVRKNIAYVPSLLNQRNNKRTQEAVGKLLEVVQLAPDLLDRYPSELSGGQRQRVGIARALAAQPDILLMDEPFGAVDEITRKTLQNEIIRIYKELGVTIVFITHDIKEALKLGTHVLVMNKGKIEQFGTPQEILNAPASPFVKELAGNQ